MNRFRKILRACLIPALRALGAAALCYWLVRIDATTTHLLVAIVCTLLGGLAVFVWRAFFRRGKA